MYRRIGVAFFACALCSGACTKGVFICHDDSQCLSAGKDGSCEPPGYCAFPDASCASGKRFGSHADMGLAHECTDPPGTTGDTIDPTVAEGTQGEESSAGTSPPTSTTVTTTSADEGPEPVCGNGMVEPGEACDGDPVPSSCENLGHSGGVLTCSEHCTFDDSGCFQCGNDVLEGTEQCDGSNLGGQVCASVGFFGGTLACASDCTFDTAACNDCGNGIVDPGELCDGDFMDVTCLSLGFGGMGSPGCNSECQLDLDVCGDILCGNDPDQPFTECPPECTECVNGICQIQCVGDGVCASDEIVCPEGWPCAVFCEGSNACSSATVTCPQIFGCSMSCTGSGACSSAELDCSDNGSCYMSCVMGSNVCSSADVVCGHDDCGSFCGSMLQASALPSVECPMGSGCVCGECLD